MTLKAKDLQKISELACLDIENESELLGQDVNKIMDFVEQLRSVNTNGTAPLFHPFDLHQPLRADVISEENCAAELEEIAPLFDEENSHYLVPQVIDSGK
ncbi:Asp-tRNA(Asn)/Glu-tRNA(Gln) amidotransferase subunit GatC [Legionella israelensis]|uniref:Aspartyl/glutamyl-tRNA(Asn/Gln) amidotransferase subunit C n=1 Tax=Legionella israelensis TaxID=454 RepID=A0A0W0W3F6_9GAMM|nr:Asp-tRNA(Asn)/Glu-tRNA(Gln) amidotransferase subunit GatC [Legionella israelensis]KTD26892.1 glutamyl-tRNA(Gln) amidotransferase subunit C [Legionella israelensis]QBS08558.1 Asp-tRNA(Asn)/Glu-tRNA(Gln) amidotransferase subunit GatC [Legionella israelensis]SCX76158.1 aspartyl/glutamyl-tRNA(Asn/Gln) amidotransferase subunit C [Legionella israelensis DSM 19235]STX58210.1 glutamyl-tRNA(Gln) amidotransferase subunit C [Legionella israelensis]